MEPTSKPQPVQPELQAFFVFLSRYGDKILALLPLAFLIWVVVQYAVVVPYLDQWELVPLLEKTYHGELTFHDLWAQHNEHRLIFPQIIMLLLALPTALGHSRSNRTGPIVFGLGCGLLYLGFRRISAHKL